MHTGRERSWPRVYREGTPWPLVSLRGSQLSPRLSGLHPAPTIPSNTYIIHLRIHKKKRAHFHLDSFHAHHNLQADVPGLAWLCSLFQPQEGRARRRERAVALRLGLNHAVNSGQQHQRTQVRRTQPNSSGLKYVYFFLLRFREVRVRGKEEINLNSYKGKLNFFSHSKKLILTLLFLRQRHSF